MKITSSLFCEVNAILRTNKKTLNRFKRLIISNNLLIEPTLLDGLMVVLLLYMLMRYDFLLKRSLITCICRLSVCRCLGRIISFFDWGDKCRFLSNFESCLGIISFFRNEYFANAIRKSKWLKTPQMNMRGSSN